MNSCDHSDTEACLAELGWLPHNQRVVAVATAGAGNMNQVDRITLNDGTSLILKRAHPWVQKYPDIPAPIERAAVEAAFYRAVAGHQAGAAMPAHLGHAEAVAANLFADLGEGRDGMTAYRGDVIATDTIDNIADWLRALHSLPPPFDQRLANRSMRELNALHIFDFPLDPGNGFDVDSLMPGLQEHADRLKQDADFVEQVAMMKAIYLSDAGGVLLHGDLYPGSWLTTPDGLFIIDPEFCWVGPPEWDIGVLCAHLRLAGQPRALEDRFCDRYGLPLDLRRCDMITGIEIMRRLIGVAQLPLVHDLSARVALLEEARSLVLGNHR